MLQLFEQCREQQYSQSSHCGSRTKNPINMVAQSASKRLRSIYDPFRAILTNLTKPRGD